VIVIGLLSIGHHAKTVAAQQADPPQYTVGDRWERSNGQIVSVVAIDQQAVTFTGLFPLDCPACLVRFGHDRSWIGISDERNQPVRATRFRFLPVGSGWRFFAWPLVVGEEWVISAHAFFKGNPYPFAVVCRVESYGEVVVKAGRFEAFRIRRDWSYHDAYGTYSWTNDVAWYSPRVKDYVKIEAVSGAGDWELTSYTVR
jgi:hypothetical protein